MHRVGKGGCKASKVASKEKAVASKQKAVPYQVRFCSDRRYGLGVFAKVTIPANSCLFEYTGVRLVGSEIGK